MCELLGMNCNVPTDIRFSFSGLIERGGRTGPHSDGWGIAFYEDRGCRAFHDPHPGCESEIAALVRSHAQQPRTGDLRALIGRLAAVLNACGTFNMMLCDARQLYCYCSTDLSWLTRRAPFGEASLIDAELTVDFAHETTPKDVVTVIATRPLTLNEPWQVMARGSMVVFRNGLRVAA